jgi:hypothetical protein
MDQILENIIIVFVVIFFLRILYTISRPQTVSKQDGKPDCPPHKWTYDTTGNMFCTQCNKRPGEILSDYDKPY